VELFTEKTRRKEKKNYNQRKENNWQLNNEQYQKF